MGLKLNMLAAAAVLSIPMAAGAQASPAQPATSPAAAQADASPQADAKTDTGTKAKTDAKTAGTAAKADTAAAGKADTAAVGKADIKAGALVYDSEGNALGKIESVDAKGAVLNTGTVKATIPVSGFSKGDKGLTFGMSKAELEAAAKKAK